MSRLLSLVFWSEIVVKKLAFASFTTLDTRIVPKNIHLTYNSTTSNLKRKYYDRNITYYYSSNPAFSSYLCTQDQEKRFVSLLMKLLKLKIGTAHTHF